MSKAKRTDPHCPKNIDPADYSYEREILVHIPAEMTKSIWGDMEMIKALLAEIKANFAWYDEQGFQSGNFRSKRTCDHCGAWFGYGTAFRHIPTNEVIVVGWQCAEETMDVPNKAVLADKRLRKRVAAVRATFKSKVKTMQAQKDAFTAYPELEKLLETDHYIAKDIKGRFDQYGTISDKQVALLKKLAADADKPREPETDWQPVESGRRAVTGTILTTKYQESQYGTTLKMLVHLDGDQKVWGTCPGVLSEKPSEVCSGAVDYRDNREMRGLRVSFTATFERSHDDPKFGFFKRPSKAKVMEKEAEVVA